MKKLKIYFPKVEAGMGHIMPMKAVRQSFEKKYGNDERFEIIYNDFFKDSDDEVLHKFEKKFLVANLVAFQKFHAWGYFANFFDFIFPPSWISFFTSKFGKRKAWKAMNKRMDEINPDIVFSTHWVTNYIVMNRKGKRPYSITFCPDCSLDKLFSYPSDIKLISTESGYKKGLRKRNLTEENFKKVPFCIRNEAFTTEKDKVKVRKELNLPLDKFTIIIVEGAYGNGRLEKLCKALVKTNLSITILAICGDNPKLVKELKGLEVNKNISFYPIGFTTEILKYISASDLYLGKSGNGINESTFFKIPSIITSYTNFIEQDIAKYFIKEVGSAQRCNNIKKIIALIDDYSKHREKMQPYIDNCEKVKDNYGAEKTADIIYQAAIKLLDK